MHVTLRHLVDGHLLAVDWAWDQPGRGADGLLHHHHTLLFEKTSLEYLTMLMLDRFLSLQI